jgi:hypothetical protein
VKKHTEKSVHTRYPRISKLYVDRPLVDRQNVGEGARAVEVTVDSGGLELKMEPVKIEEDLRGGRIPTRLGFALVYHRPALDTTNSAATTAATHSTDVAMPVPGRDNDARNQISVNESVPRARWRAAIRWPSHRAPI